MPLFNKRLNTFMFKPLSKELGGKTRTWSPQPELTYTIQHNIGNNESQNRGF